MIRAQDVIPSLQDRFGPIGDPLVWYGTADPSLRASLDEFDHLIDREGILQEICGDRAEQMAVAYFVSRLTSGKSSEDLHWAYGAEMYKSQVVINVGEIGLTETVLGCSFESGRSKTETRIEKANFLSPSGLIATVRQAARGVNADFVVNRGGFAELAINELLPEVQEVTKKFVQTQNN